MRGFLLIELIIVIGIIGVISTIVYGGYRGVQSVRDPLNAGRTYVRSLSDASARARTMSNDSNWGVRVNTGSIVTFSGNTYATRDTTQDRSIPISSAVTVTGVSESVFSKYYGIPTVLGTTTFSSTLASSTAVILPNGEAQFTP